MTGKPALDVVREARINIAASLIAVKGHLDTRYPDDPRWTPCVRFIEGELQMLDEDYKDALSRLGQLVDAASALDYVHELDSNYPPGWNWERDGDYVLNEDGSKKHAEDCAGCRFEAALRAVAGDPDNQEVVA